MVTHAHPWAASINPNAACRLLAGPGGVVAHGLMGWWWWWRCPVWRACKQERDSLAREVASLQERLQSAQGSLRLAAQPHAFLIAELEAAKARAGRAEAQLEAAQVGGWGWAGNRAALRYCTVLPPESMCVRLVRLGLADIPGAVAAVLPCMYNARPISNAIGVQSKAALPCALPIHPHPPV